MWPTRNGSRSKAAATVTPVLAARTADRRAMLLAERDHHTAPRGQRQARSGEEVRVARHGQVPVQPPPQPELFQLFEEERGGSRPPCLDEPRRGSAAHGEARSRYLSLRADVRCSIAADGEPVVGVLEAPGHHVARAGYRRKTESSSAGRTVICIARRWRKSWWKCHGTLSRSLGSSSRSPTFQHFVALVAFKVSSQHRVFLRLSSRGLLRRRSWCVDASPLWPEVPAWWRRVHLPGRPWLRGSWGATWGAIASSCYPVARVVLASAVFFLVYPLTQWHAEQSLVLAERASVVTWTTEASGRIALSTWRCWLRCSPLGNMVQYFLYIFVSGSHCFLCLGVAFGVLRIGFFGRFCGYSGAMLGSTVITRSASVRGAFGRIAHIFNGEADSNPEVSCLHSVAE